MFNRTILMAAALLGLSLGVLGCAQTNAQEEEFEPEVVSIPEYQEFLTELREALAEGEPRELTPPETRRYERIDSRMNDLLDQYETVDDMNRENRVKLFNLHQELEALIAGRDQDQVICRRQHTVGTHFKREQCRTRAEWEAAREDSREFMHNSFRRLAIDPSSSN